MSTTQNTRSADLWGSWVHHLLDQRGERDDAGGVLAATVDLRAVHVVRGEMGHRAFAGAPEDALDTACGLYLGDPTAWI